MAKRLATFVADLRCPACREPVYYPSARERVRYMRDDPRLFLGAVKCCGKRIPLSAGDIQRARKLAPQQAVA